MVIAKQNGNVLVHVGPKIQAYPEELVRQRCGHNGHTEYLIRWHVLSSENDTGSSTSASLTESKMENILMWMPADDVYANCPTLLGERKPKSQQQEEKASHILSPGVTLDEASLLEMKKDVKNLVQRATWQMASSTVPQSSILNTIHVLSAYASIASLMGVFKETGALDLLMKMLCHEEKHIRRSAVKMLRALASHDAGSRAYVLLSLSQQDGIEQHMDFDSRYTLLELFAETTSSEEHGMSFEGIPLPQLPGKLLFSLVKRYLCATSLLDKLNSTTDQAVECDHSVPSSATSEGKKRLLCEFDFSMAMAHLISELVQVMGWNRSLNFWHLKAKRPQGIRSIFQPQIPICASIPSATQLSQKEDNIFKQHSAFTSRNSYVEYVKEKLMRGMHVRMLEDYEKVSAGDEGEFLQCNNGTPPLQVYWESLGRTYWVHWHMVEIVATSRHAYQEGQKKVSSLTETLREDTVYQTVYCKPLGGLYSMPYLTDQINEVSGTLNRAEWWELLFFVKTLEPNKQQELLELIQQNHKLLELDEEGLIQLLVSVELAQQVLHFLSEHCQGCTQSDLQSSQVYLKYSFGQGRTEQNCQNVNGIPTNCGGFSETLASKKPKKELLSAEVPSPASTMAEKTDRQLINELLKMEGLSFPDILDEKTKAFCSVKVAGKKSSLEQLADAMEMIQKSSNDMELQMAGLKFIAKLLEEEPGREWQEKQVLKSESEISIREKMVKMLVELLSYRVKEKLFIVLMLQVLYVLMAKYDWRVPFASQGGLHSVLRCIQEHPTSAAVQQAGLAILKVLLGAGNCELPGACWKPYPLDHVAVQMMQQTIANVNSSSSKDPYNLLCVIPTAIEKMLTTPGALGGVQNGLLVLNKVVDYCKELVKQLENCGLYSVLQSCCESDQSSNEILAQIMLRHLTEHKLPQGQENTDSGASFKFKDVALAKLVSSLHTSHICKEIVAALEYCLCGQVTHPEENIYELLLDVLLLKDLAKLGSKKDVHLEALRILNKCLANSQKDDVPWHKTIEPCLSSMIAHINDREIVQEFICFLHCLATINKDCAVLMCCMGAQEALTKVMEKHSSSLLWVTEMGDILSNCEKYASLYKTMTVSILAGCIQMVLGQIEEHRQSHQPINIPFFDVLLHNLCQGCSMEVKEDKCWERVEVSSNPQMANNLTDGNPKTYWESNGSTGSHYINVYMHHGVVVQQMSLLVASEDSSYMPARIMVMGGESTSSISTKLNMVNIPPLANKVILLENMSCFWPIIQIKIKRCQQGGIDTRVRGLEVLGPKPTFWPIFKEQLCRRTFLFYTTKAHTWCQEISEDRMQLLQLFNRLNSVLRHEQVFADHFLPDDEAAQALGKTCWEALITPLVQNITSPDPSGISSLSWLLSQYLDNLEAAWKGKNQAAIFNSCVRHLSHLLVHVDSSSSEPEEMKPLAKSTDGKNGKNIESRLGAVKEAVKKPSSTAGIAQCWKGVVQQQVKWFLEFSWQASDFVEQYCSTYLRLRTAMEELFGQQMSFRLALCHGFSGGLLQLSFLTAMHVSEQFARYIDHWIQESWADSGNVETLQHLQQSLEPILFLAGLELANTFEHFYRYYLGDRLLSQGKTWLECAVVEHIGLCFPNRFPQQMLKNLSELEEQQQQFHLFQLQQLDKRLLQLDRDGKCEEEEQEGEMMEDEESCSQDEETEVKVLALSPRCWTISPHCYLDEPIKFFPSSLSQQLGRFADFYTQSQSRFGLEHTKPRRLQWTWLGHAELEYQGCTLHVSTLQMYILLCFNNIEEVSMETLLQSTGLSPVLLNHALKPLTKEKGILIQSETVLKLNERILAQLSGQRLWLLPKQTYLNVEENEGSALERKRNIISCLLIQILKEEKEIHIDNLVFKVIDACQKWESGSALKFLSFCCSSTDVLSCILHLLSQGYIRRQEDSPQLLEYISAEPTTPHRGQAQLIFQNSDGQKKNTPPGTNTSNKFSPFRLDTFGLGTEQVLMETVLLPMGRTMNQEEVEVLMNQTVERVADTLTLTADIAQHLLIHCKWNVDVLIQRYTEDSEQLLFSSGLQVRNPQPPSSPVTHCPVCLNQLSQADNPPVLCCMHYCCKSCWNEYLATRIEQNLILNCICPISDCPAQPTTDFIRSIISSKEVIAKYEKALLRGYVECCSNLTWCTNPQGCDQILCKEGLGCGEACSKCSWISCFNCNFPEAHYPASCSHMSQWMDDGGFYEGMTVEAQSKHLAKLISKRCPSCQAQIEKNEGCLHMTCAKCNHGFCWRCLKPWKPTHKDYYNCSAMVSKAARQEKRFQDYNERCTFHHQAREFAMNLRNRVSTVSDVPQVRTLKFVVDACKMLEQARKVLAYSCVYSYYNQDTEKMDIMEQQSENLELHTNALQILLEETLLQCQDLASSIQLLKAEHFNTGLELVRRIQERLLAILQHATQDFRVGFQTRQSSEQMEVKLSNVPNATSAYKELVFDEAFDAADTDDGKEEEEDEDEEYVPEWQEEYDDDDLDDDNISYDDESENLERDSFFFEDEDDAYE